MTTEQPYRPPAVGQPYSGYEPDHWAERRLRRTLRLHTILHVVTLALVAVTTTIAILATVKYFQVVNAIQDFGDQFSSSFETPSPSPSDVPPGCYVDPTDPSCPPGFDPGN